MTTIEDLLGNWVGFATQLYCSFCQNKLWTGGSTGLWAEKCVLPKKARDNIGQYMSDDKGHIITFLCENCAGKEPKYVPQIRLDGKGLNQINIHYLEDAIDMEQIERQPADYKLKAT
jgi:hypothetical protein